MNELESLVESKTYREDELEIEIEKLKRVALSTPSVSTHSRSSSLAHDVDADDGECEMCGEKGHDLDACPDCGSTSSLRVLSSGTGKD